MLKIVADSSIPFLKGALDQVAQVVYLPGNEIVREHILNADALIVRTRTKCNEELLQGTSIKLIASATIGFDHIDTHYCDAHSITWTNAPGCNSGSVKQYIASALAEVINSEKKLFNQLTLGIIGVGNVGSKVAALAKTLGINTLLNDPPRERLEGKDGFTDIDTLISQSDIITMHVPLSRHEIDKTFHLANSDFFAKMKRGAWFINTSRGEVVETQSLIDALQSKHLKGAVIDVWENEPTINLELLKLAHIATPHIAGYSADGKANGTAMSVQAISRFFNLGLNSGKSTCIPQAPHPNLKISTKEKTREEIFSLLSTTAYNIELDSQKLKQSATTFELQRETYPIRREPEMLRIENDDITAWANDLIRDLGYQI